MSAKAILKSFFPFSIFFAQPVGELITDFASNGPELSVKGENEGSARSWKRK